ncbi:MAG TPA: tRNA-intron lyase, partial [Candidatus Aenigmarchaeota archaeon]|nr:tRNA-intron lyase [Candidatus Aenigmarchaeota archaeon]
MPGNLVGNKVVVEDAKEANKLYNRGRYGALEGEKLTLSLVEALYLVERGKLRVFKGEQELDYDSLLKLAADLEPRFWVRYCVYRDIRRR